MLNLLLGRAIWRWLERLADEPAGAPVLPPGAPRPGPATVEFAPDQAAGQQRDPAPSEHADAARQVVGRPAMGSAFEVHLVGPQAEAQRAVAEEALDEVERLDRQLSHYRPDSDISRLNVHASGNWVRVEPRLYALLRRCAALSAETRGAFDITAAPLVRLWGFHDGRPRVPTDEEVAETLGRTGWEGILFDDEEHLVRFAVPGMELTLGAVGKGLAIDEAVARARFYGLDAALVHGGQSTIYAVGAPPGRPGWYLTLRDPRDRETPLQDIVLRDQALSTSAAYEQSFEKEGVRYGHILDPRTGRPAHGPLSVWVTAPTAELSDALATACYVLGPSGTEEYCTGHANIGVVMAGESPDGSLVVQRFGTLAEPTGDGALPPRGEQA